MVAASPVIVVLKFRAMNEVLMSGSLHFHKNFQHDIV